MKKGRKLKKEEQEEGKEEKKHKNMMWMICHGFMRENLLLLFSHQSCSIPLQPHGL